METHLLRTIPETECEIINLTSFPNNINWEKEDEIFILNGIVYDVAKTKKVNGNVYLYCITENKETEMLDDITLKFSCTNESGKDCKLAFSQDYILPYKNHLELFNQATAIFLQCSTTLTQRSRNINLPPPRNFNYKA